MQKLTVNSPCKINLSLDILGLREDNYHYVDMILQTVSLSDTVCITRNESQKITVSTNLIYLPNNEKNIAFKSAVLFFDACQIPKKDRGVHIRIDKKVPICAGLGGGSYNSAAVFCGLTRYIIQIYLKRNCRK